MRQSSRSLRLAAAALAPAAVLVAVAIGCGDNIGIIPACNTPTVGEKGVDGGLDPCHCDPPPSLNVPPCGCLSNPMDQGSIDDYRQCITSYQLEVDAGAGGGGP